MNNPSEPTIPERIDQLNQAFGAKPGGVPSFTAEREGDDYLFGQRPKKTNATIAILARVGDSEVLNEIATLEPEVTIEPITERRAGDAAVATVRVSFDLAGALRAAADEVDRENGNDTVIDYETMGDIADAFRSMKDDGMTRSSILYAFERVYPQHEESDEAQRKMTTKEIIAYVLEMESLGTWEQRMEACIFIARGEVRA